MAEVHVTKPRLDTWSNWCFNLTRNIILTSLEFYGQHQWDTLPLERNLHDNPPPKKKS